MPRKHLAIISLGTFQKFISSRNSLFKEWMENWTREMKIAWCIFSLSCLSMTIIIYWARFTDIIYRYISAVFRWFIRKRDIPSLESPWFGIWLCKRLFLLKALSLILHSNGYLQYEVYLSRVFHSNMMALYYSYQSPKKIFS